jgi:transcriptional regulator with XRE-family HTH domain
MTTKKYYGIEDLRRKYGPMTIAMFIKSWRQADEISQVKFAKMLGISRANLCDIEKGRKLVNPGRAARFAKIIGVPQKVLVQLSLEDLLRTENLKYKVKLD